MISFENRLTKTLDKRWIFFYKVYPYLTLLDRPLTDIVFWLDSVWTDPVHGQTLDRVLTDIGQRLDFTSNLCPKFVCPLFSKEYQEGLPTQHSSRTTAAADRALHIQFGCGGKGKTNQNITEFEIKVGSASRKVK